MNRFGIALPRVKVSGSWRDFIADSVARGSPANTVDAMGRPSFHTFLHDGLEFRDLDHDGVLAPFEDWRLTPLERVDDLVNRMSLAEKVGLMLHGTLPSTDPILGRIGHGDAYDVDAATSLVLESHISSLITRLSPMPDVFAEQNNQLQSMATNGRFGIPLSISSDPRHHVQATLGAGVAPTGFSQWPPTLGLAAIGERELVRRFGEVVRTEYRAVGIHVALSPMADLATSPRWPRTDGTFGSHPGLVRLLVGAYIEGLQGGVAGVGVDGVAAVVKHWVGYGASRDGFDGHNYYGRYSSFPGGAFDDHVEGFLDAFRFGVAGVMPTYNILEEVSLDGVPLEQVGAGFNSQLLQGLLRGSYGFGGLVLSDWAIMNDLTESGRTGEPAQGPADIAMPWGVDGLSRIERVAKGVNAGLDQIGGENDPSALLAAIARGLVSEQRIDESARRVLVQKFAMGLFEDPFVDPELAASVVGSAEFAAEGASAGRRSPVVLAGSLSPVVGERVFVHGISADVARASLATVDDPARASVAVIRLAAPAQDLHPTFFFGSRQHEGDLDFKGDDPGLALLMRLPAGLRKIVVVTLDRAAVVSAVIPFADVLIADFGASDSDLLSALWSPDGCLGRLPFELPSSMEAVLAGSPDRPNDSADPLFPIFHSANHWLTSGGRRLRPLSPGTLAADQLVAFTEIAEGPRSKGKQRQLLTDGVGALVGPFNAMMLSPIVGGALGRVGEVLRFGSVLTDRERELAVLTVAKHWGSAFEWSAHIQLAVVAGVSADEIAAIESGSALALVDRRESCVLSLAQQLVGTWNTSDAAYVDAVAALGHRAVFELVTLVGHYSHLALHLRVFDGEGR
jgi:beta-glucosidase